MPIFRVVSRHAYHRVRRCGTATRAAALYGPRFVDGTVNGPVLGARTVTYCFVDETELIIGFDEAGYVTALRVAAPVE